MIPLHQNGAGCAFVTIQGTTGDAGDILTFDDFLAVQLDGYQAADQRDFQALPFARFLCGVQIGSQEAVYAADAMAVDFHPVIVFDLNFMTASQIDAAVTSLRIAKFRFQFEIGEFLFGHDVVTGCFVDQQSIPDHPTVGDVGMAWNPTVEIFAIESLMVLPHLVLPSRSNDGARLA